MFRGEFPDPEIWEDCHGPEWSKWIALFLPLVNNRHGFFQHLPFAGAWMDQPATTMRILQAVQGVYFGYLREVNKVPGV